jgi:hypothetical protein
MPLFIYKYMIVNCYSYFLRFVLLLAVQFTNSVSRDPKGKRPEGSSIVYQSYNDHLSWIFWSLNTLYNCMPLVFPFYAIMCIGGSTCIPAGAASMHYDPANPKYDADSVFQCILGL